MKNYFVCYTRMGIQYQKYYPAISKKEAEIELLESHPDAEDIVVRNGTKNVPGITSHARVERVQRTFYPEQTAGYPRL